MTLFLILWFADLCDNLSKAFGIAIGLAVVSGLLLYLILVDDVDCINDEVRLVLKKYVKLCTVFLFIFGFIVFLAPSSKTIYIATGFNEISKATKTVADSDTAKKAITLLNIKLDEYINESQESKK